MLLSELKEQVARLSRLAKKEGIDPEVRMVTLPKFPTSCSVKSELVSSLDDGISLESVGGEHLVYFGESKELGPVAGEVRESFGWD